MGTEIEWQAIRLGIPVACPTVFLACKSLGTDVQARIISSKRLVQVEDVEADGLLCGIVARYGYIGPLPNPLPGHHVVL